MHILCVTWELKSHWYLVTFTVHSRCHCGSPLNQDLRQHDSHVAVCNFQGAVAIYHICPKHILHSNLPKVRSSRTSSSVAKSFWQSEKRTTAVLSWSMQNFKSIWQLNNVIWENESSQDSGFRCASDGCVTLQQPTATLITVGINNHMPSKVWNEITHQFLNFNGCTVKVYEWISNFIPHFVMDAITYPCWD